MSTVENQRSRSFLKSFRDVALGQDPQDESYLDALMIHAWLNQLLVQAAAALIHELLAKASAPLPDGPGLTTQRAEELIAEIKASRDAR